MIPKATLEQWAAFKAIVETGSFARAAEHLNKSQSTISYAISRLEAQLPAPLFEQTGRRATLTAFGKALLAHVDQLLSQAHRIDQVASALAAGWATEVTLAVDGIACLQPVLDALAAFSAEHPQTRIRLLETTLSGTDEALLTRQADLAITPRIPPGFQGHLYGQATKIPIVSKDHPLTDCPPPISEATLKAHRQIVVRDSGQKREQDVGWLGADQRWMVTHFATSIQAIKNGLGFGFIPQEMVAPELASGDLVPLTLALGGRSQIALYVIPAAQESAGQATQAVMQALLARRRTHPQGTTSNIASKGGPC